MSLPPLSHVAFVPDDEAHLVWLHRFVSPSGMLVAVGDVALCNQLAESFSPREIMTLDAADELAPSWPPRAGRATATREAATGVRTNVVQLSGWISQSLPALFATKPTSVALVRIGAAGAATAPAVLALLNERIAPGTVIVVDNGASLESGADQGGGPREAMHDWAGARGRVVTPLSRSTSSSAWAVTL